MKYNIEKVKKCADWVRENGLMGHGGATLVQFCKAMDISQETYYQWMGKSEFSEAIKRAQGIFLEALEREIVKSLYKSACGYEYEERAEEYVTRDGEEVLKKRTVTTKRTHPNVTAGIFLLTNLAPDRWKSRQSNEHTGQIDTGITFIVENDEQKHKLLALAERKPRQADTQDGEE